MNALIVTETQPNPEGLNPGYRPTLVLPGFTWGIESMEGFANALTTRKHMSGDEQQVFIADYYMKSPSEFKNPPKKGDNATDTLGAEVLAFIEAKGLQQTPLDIVGFSYGTLIYQSALRQAKERGWRSLAPDIKDPTDKRAAVFMGPSGSLEHDTPVHIIGRYVKNVGKLAVQVGLTDPALKEQTMRFVTNPYTRLKEANDLGNDTINYKELEQFGINYDVLGFNSDDVYPSERLDAGVPEGRMNYLADDSAVHSQPYLDPVRSAHATLDLLRNPRFTLV